MKQMTTKDIARICGVSRGTVDRALNDRSGINSETRERVLRVAAELGYQPHLLARSLVKGRSMTIGLVIFDLRHQFFTQLYSAINDRARRDGYRIFPIVSGKNPDEEIAGVNHAMGLNVDGIILFPVNKGRQFDQFLASVRKPVVTVGNRVSAKWSFVGIDDHAAMYDAAGFLLRKGYRTIYYYSPPLDNADGENIYEVEQRYAGFRECMKDGGSRARSYLVKEKEVADYFDRIDFSEQEKPCVLCSSDWYALRVLRYLKSRGLRVPGDVGLMGFDNLDVLEWVEPRLTTVDYHIGAIGERAVDVLLAEIRGASPGAVVEAVPHGIVEGESA